MHIPLHSLQVCALFRTSSTVVGEIVVNLTPMYGRAATYGHKVEGKYLSCFMDVYKSRILEISCSYLLSIVTSRGRSLIQFRMEFEVAGLGMKIWKTGGCI